MRSVTLCSIVVVWCSGFVKAGEIDPHLDPLNVPEYELTINDEDKNMIFEYLDRDNDGVLLDKDRALMFNHHPEAAPNVAKMVRQVGCQSEDGSDLNFQKLSDFLTDKAVTWAIYECIFVRSIPLRKDCNEDQLVAYIHLALPKADIANFFASFQAPSGINSNIVKSLFPEDKEEYVQKFLRELAGKDDVIDPDEFDQYVRQEDLHDDFRACYGETREYDYGCLRSKLLTYATQSITEMDIANIFQSIDYNSNGIIEPSDIFEWCQNSCDPNFFLTLMNPDQDDSVVEFGEFRTFIKKETIRIPLEKACSGKHAALEKELVCYKAKLFQIVTEHPKPIFLWLPDADVLFIFEDLDEDNNGQIEIEKDLQKKGYTHDIAEKFRKEMDGEDKDMKVSLQEFNEYMSSPSVVYALSVCKATPRGLERIEAYKQELLKYITNILDKEVIDQFYKSYDVNENGVITYDDLKKVMKKDDEIQNFLRELGVEDTPIVQREFEWYVRQQELSLMFKARPCNDDIPCLQSVLLEYILKKLTEPSIQRLFRILDRDFGQAGRGGIDFEDLRTSKYFKAKADYEIEQLIQKMDSDQDGVINFEEFRNYLLLHGGKEHLEADCVSPHKIDQIEMNCYLEKIWEI